MAFSIIIAPMKETVFINKHRELKARMFTFAGYLMPLEYSGIRDEHITVRQAAGVFDVSHMGEFWIKGPEAAGFLQRITSNDIQQLKPGGVQYTCLPNLKAGIVDDVLLYMYDENKYFMVVNASNIEKDWKWLNRQNETGAILENSSHRISQLSVQGPRAKETLQKLCETDLSEIKRYTFLVCPFAGVDEVIISATGYTGAGGFELYFYNQPGEKIWDEVIRAGQEFGIKPVGLAARDTLRIEMGYCLYGNDIDETTSPIEAGLGVVTKFFNHNQFIGREVMEKQKQDGVTRELVGFIMLEKGIPRQHYEILNPEGMIIGEVTSGTLSPMMNVGIGMGYVMSGFTEPGTEIMIQVRNKQLKAEVVQMPIYKKIFNGRQGSRTDA